MPLELTLPAISCGHCVRAVTETVQRVDPQAQVTVDLPTHTVRIQSGQPAQPFVQALAEAGYPAS